METVVSKKLYEAMFLIDSAKAASDWDGVITTIKNILEKSDADIVSIKKWGERKLAYDIKGKSRGTYILCYFRVDGKRIQEIEREIKLSEQIMRALILSAELMSQEDIDKQTPAMLAEKHDQQIAQKAAEKAAKPEEPIETAEPTTTSVLRQEDVGTDGIEEPKSADGGEESEK